MVSSGIRCRSQAERGRGEEKLDSPLKSDLWLRGDECATQQLVNDWQVIEYKSQGHMAVIARWVESRGGEGGVAAWLVVALCRFRFVGFSNQMTANSADQRSQSETAWPRWLNSHSHTDTHTHRHSWHKKWQWPTYLKSFQITPQRQLERALRSRPTANISQWMRDKRKHGLITHSCVCHSPPVCVCVTFAWLADSSAAPVPFPLSCSLPSQSVSLKLSYWLALIK